MEDKLIVPMVDEEGNEANFEHLMTFDHLGEHYIALMPVDEVDGIGDDEVLILHIKENGGEEEYESVDNDLLLDEVFETFIALMDEEEENDSM